MRTLCLLAFGTMTLFALACSTSERGGAPTESPGPRETMLNPEPPSDATPAPEPAPLPAPAADDDDPDHPLALDHVALGVERFFATGIGTDYSDEFDAVIGACFRAIPRGERVALIYRARFGQPEIRKGGSRAFEPSPPSIVQHTEDARFTECLLQHLPSMADLDARVKDSVHGTSRLPARAVIVQAWSRTAAERFSGRVEMNP
ncbi:MAG: hypothetical protein IT385_10710 [Deltaproteobacteria bacterium]|nr:hypothetical protein [Deltaproteobacteria bacterium]